VFAVIEQLIVCCPQLSAGAAPGFTAHGITVPEVFRAFTGDDAAAERVLTAGILGDDDHRWLERRVARRRTKIDQ